MLVGGRFLCYSFIVSYTRLFLTSFLQYDGWSNLNFLAEEMIDFESRLPFLIIGSTCIVILSYVSVNLAYFSVMSSSDIVDSDAIAIDFGQDVQGNILAGMFAGGVALSAAGSCNGSILTGGRGFYAVAREKMVLCY